MKLCLCVRVWLPERCIIQDLNSRILAWATHRPTSLTLLVSGNHGEQIHFYVISSSAPPVVLGSPWLATNNPQIDWSTGTITACVWRVIHGACVPPFHQHLWTWTRTSGSLSSTTPSLRLRH